MKINKHLTPIFKYLENQAKWMWKTGNSHKFTLWTLTKEAEKKGKKMLQHESCFFYYCRREKNVSPLLTFSCLIIRNFYHNVRILYTSAIYFCQLSIFVALTIKKPLLLFICQSGLFCNQHQCPSCMPILMSSNFHVGCHCC